MTDVTPLSLSAAGKSAAAASSASGICGLLLTAAIWWCLLDKVALSGREKLIHRELEVLEKCAGVFGIADTFFVGHAEVKSGDQQLDIPFQLDDTELTQGDKELTAVVCDHQIVIKAAANVSGNVGNSIVAAGIQHLAAQNYGIHDFHHSHRQIGALRILNVLGTGHIAGTEDTGAALAAEQHGAFVIDGQTAEGLGPSHAAEGVQRHLVEITHIHREKATVIGDGFYIDIGPEQFCGFGFDIDGIFQNDLRRSSEIDTEIFQAFFFAAGVVNFPRMDTNSLTRRGIPAERAGGNLFRHIDKPPDSD